MSSSRISITDYRCSRHLVRGLSLIVVLAISTVDADRSDRLEQQYLDQLTSRQLFGMAEQHCSAQIALHTDKEDQARWTLRLCQTYRQHAWFANGANRDALLHQAIEQITTFLQRETIVPETELSMRLHQIRALAQTARIRLLLYNAGHLSETGMVTAEPGNDRLREGNIRKTGGTRQEGRVSPDGMPPEIPEVVRGIELATALLKQLETIRRELDATRVRDLRQDARLVIAELQSLQMQQANDVPDDQRRQTENLLESVARSAGSSHQRIQARWLHAELTLYSADPKSFELKVAGVAEPVETVGPRSAVSLRIRNLLRTGKPSDALQLCIAARPLNALQQQELAWLKLEAMLGLFQIAEELDDRQLLLTTAADFEQLTRESRRLTRGVFFDACERVVARFALIREVGSEVAELVQTVDALRRDNQIPEALTTLKLALQRLPARTPVRSKAALLLRNGELLIQTQQWAAAHDRLEESVRLFSDADMHAEAAAADLLQVFCIGQLWNLQPERPEAKQRYRTALVDHVQTYSTESTARRAREWLLQMVAAEDALHAAEMAFELIDENAVPQEVLHRAEQMGELLRSAESVQSTDAKSDRDSLTKKFRELQRSLREESEVLSDSQRASLELLDLELQLQHAGKGSVNWPVIRARLESICRDLQQAVAEDAISEGSQKLLRCSVLEFLAVARTESDTDRLQSLQRSLLNQNGPGAWETARILHRFYHGAAASAPGDFWLAKTVQKLMHRVLRDNDEAPVTFEQLLQQLRISERAAEFTGDLDLRESLLNAVMATRPDASQLQQIAAVLTSSDVPGSTDRRVVRRFWQRVFGQHVQGSEPWLEATFNLAHLAAADGDLAEAEKRLGLVKALYPDWGTPDRRERATELADRLKTGGR